MAQVQTEAKPIVNRNQALGWLRQMMLIRRFEERAEMMYQKGTRSAASSTSTAARSRWRSARSASSARTTMSSPPTATTATPWPGA